MEASTAYATSNGNVEEVANSCRDGEAIRWEQVLLMQLRMRLVTKLQIRAVEEAANA